MKSFVEFIQEHLIVEGIDFDYKTKTVSYNPSHEDNVDTSIENNPSVDSDIVPDIEVWSIFKRKRGNRGDGNPLVYALKGEGWTFKSKKDKENIEHQFAIIADKFLKEHKFSVTILLPSGNELNKHIANIILSKASDSELVEGAIHKITTKDVEEIVLDFNSKFRKTFKDDFDERFAELQTYLSEMDKHRDGYFSRHFVKNDKMRDSIDETLKVSKESITKFATKINDKDILLIDDTISRGQSIKSACSAIQESYSPKSITVLTLLSKLS